MPVLPGFTIFFRELPAFELFLQFGFPFNVGVGFEVAGRGSKDLAVSGVHVHCGDDVLDFGGGHLGSPVFPDSDTVAFS